MSAKKEERRTIFRRIGGRIVPISVGVGAVAAGKKLNSANLGEKLNKAASVSLEKAIHKHRPAPFQADQTLWNKYFQTQGTKVGILERLYAPELKKAKAAVQYNPAKQNYFNAKGIVSPYISVDSGDAATFLHELGHAQQQGSKAYKLETAARKFYNKNASKLNETFRTFTPKMPIAKLKYTNALATLNYKFGSTYKSGFKYYYEADAWGRAFKLAKTPRMKLSVAQRSIPALGTYFAKPAARGLKHGLIAGGVGAIAYGLLKKDKK